MNKSKGKAKFINIILKQKKYHIYMLLLILITALISLIISMITANIMDYGIINKNINLLFKLLIFYILLNLLSSIFESLSEYICVKVTNKMNINIKEEIIKNLFDKNGEYYTNNKIGEIISIINSDTMTITQLISQNLYKSIANIVIAVSMIIYLFYLQWDLLIIIIVLQPLMLLIQKLLSPKIYSISNKLRDEYGESYSISQEFISNSLQFISLGLKKLFLSNFKDVLNRIYKYDLKLTITMSINNLANNFISTMSFVAILGYGGYKASMGTITIGTLIVFLQYSQKLFQPFYQLFQLIIDISKAKPSMERVFNLLQDENRNIKNIANKKIDGNITFKNISFFYKKDQNYILKNINMNFCKGNIYSIIGKSGAGKSTICNLLLGLWKPIAGEILIDGLNLQDYEIDFIRQNITLISQESFILNTSIYNNLVLDCNNTTPKDVENAIKKAGIYNEIMNMENGLESKVSDRGSNLSGGQRQRIAIARAILRNTPIVIFDEPTSALDSNTEKVVINTIKDTFKDKTVIIISHNDTVIKECNIVYKLIDGTIFLD